MAASSQTLPLTVRGLGRHAPSPQGGIGSLMRPYEVMIILDVTLEESAMQAVLNRSTELIESMGGQVGRVDKWGRRRFAYPIAHRTEGYYVVLDFSAETPLVDELGRSLRLADEVVRHKIVRLPDTTVKKAVLVATGPDDE